MTASTVTVFTASRRRAAVRQQRVGPRQHRADDRAHERGPRVGRPQAGEQHEHVTGRRHEHRWRREQVGGEHRETPAHVERTNQVRSDGPWRGGSRSCGAEFEVGLRQGTPWRTPRRKRVHFSAPSRPEFRRPVGDPAVGGQIFPLQSAKISPARARRGRRAPRAMVALPRRSPRAGCQVVLARERLRGARGPGRRDAPDRRDAGGCQAARRRRPALVRRGPAPLPHLPGSSS